MTVAFNPSGLINSLEYNLYKNVSRSKTDNQQKTEACITEADKIVEQRSAAYRKEAWVMVAFAISLVALTVIGTAIDWKIESTNSNLDKFKTNLNQLSPENKFNLDKSKINLNQLSPEKIINLNNKIESLEKTYNTLNKCNIASKSLNVVAQKAPECYSAFSRISTNQLDHLYKKKEMRLQQLQQDRSSSASQDLLRDIQEMKRRHQQAKAAAS